MPSGGHCLICHRPLVGVHLFVWWKPRPGRRHGPAGVYCSEECAIGEVMRFPHIWPAESMELAVVDPGMEL